MGQSGKTRTAVTPSARTAGDKSSTGKARTGKASAADSFNEICSVRIELLDTDPLIWRQLDAPTSLTLKTLHDIIQVCIGWYDSHLWEFRIGDQTYAPPMEDLGAGPRADAAKVRLRDVLKPGKTVIEYLYDFGDSWEHRITVTDVRTEASGVTCPRYVAGEWAGPPEDCGGIPGFYNALDAMADPQHPDHADIMEWLRGYDPKLVDLFGINLALARIANRRVASRRRITKKPT
jgi:Plasmid pRiA4b ORF-3-like protein